MEDALTARLGGTVVVLHHLYCASLEYEVD